jgi:hypothetical protein
MQHSYVGLVIPINGIQFSRYAFAESGDALTSPWPHVVVLVKVRQLELDELLRDALVLLVQEAETEWTL